MRNLDISKIKFISSLYLIKILNFLIFKKRMTILNCLSLKYFKSQGVLMILKFRRENQELF
jgi:hypothetical protein